MEMANPKKTFIITTNKGRWNFFKSPLNSTVICDYNFFTDNCEPPDSFKFASCSAEIQHIKGGAI